MDTTLIQSTRKTKSGLFVRQDPDFGLLVYSSYTGLIYAVHPSEAEHVKSWLDRPKVSPPSSVYKCSLGAGWAVPIENSKHFIPHLLPSRETWGTLPTPKSPILINWLITGRCPLGCKYCYAEDLMRNDELEPKVNSIKKIVKCILNLNPLVVVLTGGDPLFSPHLSLIIQLLNGKTGIIVDTSGYTFSATHLELFKRYNVVLRISFDSERPKVNQAQRPLYPGYPKLVRAGIPTAQAAVSALCQCLDAGLPVTVQSVATKKTANDLVALGDKLYRLGVRSWRIFKVAPSKASIDGYRKLVGTFSDKGKKLTGKRLKGPYDFVFQNVLDSYLKT